MSRSPKATCGQTPATLPSLCSIPSTLYPNSVEPLVGAPCVKLQPLPLCRLPALSQSPLITSVWGRLLGALFPLVTHCPHRVFITITSPITPRRIYLITSLSSLLDYKFHDTW